eukprot:SAG31_NODE_755_length_12319_cov_6.335542_2_plen_400_part_00
MIERGGHNLLATTWCHEAAEATPAHENRGLPRHLRALPHAVDARHRCQNSHTQSNDSRSDRKHSPVAALLGSLRKNSWKLLVAQHFFGIRSSGGSDTSLRPGSAPTVRANARTLQCGESIAVAEALEELKSAMPPTHKKPKLLRYAGRPPGAPLLLDELRFSPRQLPPERKSVGGSEFVQPPTPRGPAAIAAASTNDTAQQQNSSAGEDNPARAPTEPAAPQLRPTPPSAAVLNRKTLRQNKLHRQRCEAGGDFWKPQATSGVYADLALARVSAADRISKPQQPGSPRGEAVANVQNWFRIDASEKAAETVVQATSTYRAARLQPPPRIYTRSSRRGDRANSRSEAFGGRESPFSRAVSSSACPTRGPQAPPRQLGPPMEEEDTVQSRFVFPSKAATAA